jgi:hypothetical protein
MASFDAYGTSVRTENNDIQKTKKTEKLWTMLNPETGQYEFVRQNDKDEVHIDARCYDFNMLTMRLPLCACTQ